MSQSNAIQKMSYTHEAMARWLVENPSVPLRVAAEHFGVTQPWLSRVIHSSVFQAYLRTLQDAANAAIIADIPAQMRATASRALEGLHEQVDRAADDSNNLLQREFLLDTSEMLLKSLGYGAPKTQGNGNGGGVNITNPQGPVYVVSQEDLAHARGLITARQTEPQEIDVTPPAAAS